ncbi:MAG: hypothetical protein ACYDCL_18055 [Myxococcales bacterium]
MARRGNIVGLALVFSACQAKAPAPVKQTAFVAAPGSGLALPPPKGYTGGPVAGGGAIRGRVTFTGKVPKLPPARCARDPEICGRPRPDERLLVDSSGGVRNAIVSLSDIHAGKPLPPKARAKLDIHACNYTPRVQALPLGTSLMVTNRDHIPHDLNAARGDRVLFNRVVMVDPERVDLSVPGMLLIDCDAHHKDAPCETGVIGVMPNPYYAVTGADGSFGLADVPPGTYTLTAWHETLGEKSARVTVAANGTATAELAFTKP